MGTVRVSAFGLSLDGFGAGPDQGPDDPFGKGGGRLLEWVFSTRTFSETFGGEDGSEGVDDDFAA